jgi:hypothetical protein
MLPPKKVRFRGVLLLASNSLTSYLLDQPALVRALTEENPKLVDAVDDVSQKALTSSAMAILNV